MEARDKGAGDVHRLKAQGGIGSTSMCLLSHGLGWRQGRRNSGCPHVRVCVDGEQRQVPEVGGGGQPGLTSEVGDVHSRQ